MERIKKTAALLIAALVACLTIHQSIHFYRYGHLAPLGLHADVVVTTSADLLGVEGIAKIYDGRLTNYGVLPATITVCDYLDYSGQHATMIAYIVERWEPRVRGWKFLPEWDDYGSRLFCLPAFEVAETRLVRRRVWPGQSLQVGEVIPAQRDGFHAGDDGRITIFLEADGNRSASRSTSAFRIDK